MASAVTVVFGANSTQFQGELARMQAMTLASANKISAAARAGSLHGSSGLIREAITIPREIIEGRGMGRVIGSLSLFSQYLTSATKATDHAASASRAAADAYAQEALKAEMAAVAAVKKAEASTQAALADELENEESIAASEANWKLANSALAARTALREKAAAAEADAAAEEALAAANAEAATGLGALAGFLGPFALILAIIGEAYVVFKSLATIIGAAGNAEKVAAEYTREHTLALWAEVEAMDKLQSASLKTTEAINRMNEAKDRSVELAREAMAASKAEAEQREKLYDANVKAKLLDIDIAEKKGLLTKEQADQKKAAIESQAVSDKAAAKQAELDREATIAAAAAAQADHDKAEAQKQALQASDRINNSPEGKRRAEALAQAEKDLSASKSEADRLQKKQNEESSRHHILGTPGAYFQGYGTAGNKNAALKEEADAANNAAASAQIRVDALKRFMSPDEKAAADALRIAQEKTSAAETLKAEADKASKAATINAQNSPAIVSAEQSEIQKRAQLEALSGGKLAGGYGLNSQQRIGAYAATAPILVQQLNELRGIRANTAHGTVASNHPPSERRPQMGTRPTYGPVHNIPDTRP